MELSSERERWGVCGGGFSFSLTLAEALRVLRVCSSPTLPREPGRPPVQPACQVTPSSPLLPHPGVTTVYNARGRASSATWGLHTEGPALSPASSPPASTPAPTAGSGRAPPRAALAGPPAAGGPGTGLSRPQTTRFPPPDRDRDSAGAFTIHSPPARLSPKNRDPRCAPTALGVAKPDTGT